MTIEHKITQVAAYLIQKSDGTMSHLKLMKIMYLADRESMKRYGRPITNDRLVSMDHGPVLSTTLNYINGYTVSHEDGWDSWISDKSNHMVSLIRDNFDRNDLTELSDSDIEILNDVWSEFGAMSRWDLVDYTHTLKEWENPKGTSIPIKHKDVFLALGKTEEEAERFQHDVISQRKIDELFSSL